MENNLNGFEGFLRAIAEPNRFRILQLVMDQELCVCKIYEMLHLSQNLVSHHLRILSDLDLVKVRHEKNWKHYKADKELVERYLGLITENLLFAEKEKLPNEC